MKKLAKPKKSLNLLLVILFVSQLNNCSSVKLKNGEVCGDMDKYGATCNHTFTDETRDLNKEEWDKTRIGWVCMKSDLFANWKAALIKFCNDTKRCTYEDEKLFEGKK